MSMEISAILRAILLQAKKVKTTPEVELAVQAMCTKEDIDAVEQSLQKLHDAQGGGDVAVAIGG